MFRRRRRRGRPPKPVRIGFPLVPREFYVSGASEFVVLAFPELEAMRLVDYEGKTQEEAAQLMGVSRATVWRLLQSGRRKVVDALIHGKRLVIG